MIRIHQGVDIVDISRFKEFFRRNERFMPDVFTQRERESCKSGKYSHVTFAGRFAAKEACLKALGLGLSATGIDHILQEIEIVRDKSGKPMLYLDGWAAKMSRRKKIYQHTVSISHSSNYAVATVILVGNQPEPEVSE